MQKSHVKSLPVFVVFKELLFYCFLDNEHNEKPKKEPYLFCLCDLTVTAVKDLIKKEPNIEHKDL